MEKHLNWVQEILWVRDWLIANDWLEDHVKVEFSQDRESCYCGDTELVNLNFLEIEKEKTDLEDIHIQVFLHEVGHHIHLANIDENLFRELYRIKFEGMKIIARKIKNRDIQSELYRTLPLEAEAEMAREELYKQIKQAGVI